jgi:hypothetical protein
LENPSLGSRLSSVKNNLRIECDIWSEVGEDNRKIIWVPNQAGFWVNALVKASYSGSPSYYIKTVFHTRDSTIADH